MDEKIYGREPPEIPRVWSLWVRNGTWGSNHMLNRLFGSLSWLVAASRPALLDQQTKEGQWLQLGWMRLFSPPMKSSVLNRVWLILSVKTHWGQGSATFDVGCGKWQAWCLHNLPTALSPTVLLNLPEGQTTSLGMTGWERLYGWEKERQQRWR